MTMIGLPMITLEIMKTHVGHDDGLGDHNQVIAPLSNAYPSPSDQLRQKNPSLRVRIRMCAKFQRLSFSDVESPAGFKQTNKQTDRRNFLRRKDFFAPNT